MSFGITSTFFFVYQLTISMMLYMHFLHRRTGAQSRAQRLCIPALLLHILPRDRPEARRRPARRDASHYSPPKPTAPQHTYYPSILTSLPPSIHTSLPAFLPPSLPPCLPSSMYPYLPAFPPSYLAPLPSQHHFFNPFLLLHPCLLSLAALFAPSVPPLLPP